MGLLLIKISPLSGYSKPFIILAIVVFPDPDSPTIATLSPLNTEKETSSTADNFFLLLKSLLGN